MSSLIDSRPSTRDFVDVIMVKLESEQLRLERLERYSIDGAIPEIVVEPGTVQEVGLTLSEAQKHSLAVVPVGGASQLGFGNVPDSYSVALSTQRLDALVAYEPADLTVTAEAGMRLGELQRQLAEHGQWLPADPPVALEATLGGVLATNAYGPARHAHGTLRDWLIGLRVVHPNGTSSKSGGRVVKNVTGYDMHKLHVGALGSLGVIVEATFKLAPRPRVEQTVSAACVSATDACVLARSIDDAALSLQALEVLSPAASRMITGDARWSILAKAGGSEAAVKRTLRDVRRLAQEATCEVVEGTPDAWSNWSRTLSGGPLTMRISTPAEHTSNICEALEQGLAGPSARVSATVSCGIVRVVVDLGAEDDAIEAVRHVREIASRAHGRVVVDAAPNAAKRKTDVFGVPGPDLVIMRRLKDQFDPERILSPGRFLGRL